jgi:glycosyltransferase involved in cell wall biosynthesis
MLSGPLQECLVPGRGIQAFADAVLRTINLRSPLSQAGRLRLEEFSPERIVPAWSALLTKRA